MDWQNQPLPFKLYTTLPPIEIPTGIVHSGLTAEKAILESAMAGGGECVPDLKTLGRLLFLSAGITKRSSYPGGEIYFRAAACTGALYHIDLYVVTMAIEGLEAGVYHFAPNDFSLRRLRNGDFRGYLARATGGEEAVSSAPMSIICTSTYWRNSWKYQSRAFRHTFWDNGTILANLLAAGRAYDIPARVVLGFVDVDVNRLLGLDTKREAAVSIVPIGRTATSSEEAAGDIEEVRYETSPLSREEVDYPAIIRIHEASSLSDPTEARDWRRASIASDPPKAEGRIYPLAIPREERTGSQYRTLEETIVKRGSTRVFTREPITFEQFSQMLYYSTRGVQSDFLTPPGSTLNDLYIIANDVAGIPKGAYYFRRQDLSLELLKEGDFREEAGYLGLAQELPRDANACVFFMADLETVLEKFGNRGYRAALLEAGIIMGRLYLAAYGQRLGASGLTFFDDEVTRFFSPHAEQKNAMLLVVLGKSVKRKAQ